MHDFLEILDMIIKKCTTVRIFFFSKIDIRLLTDRHTIQACPEGGMV